MVHHCPLMATCVNMGVRLEVKANVSVLIGTSSLAFPNTISWLGALKPTDNGHYSERAFCSQISWSGLQNDEPG